MMMARGERERGDAARRAGGFEVASCGLPRTEKKHGGEKEQSHPDRGQQEPDGGSTKDRSIDQHGAEDYGRERKGDRTEDDPPGVHRPPAMAQYD